jgi:hypothetical protein
MTLPQRIASLLVAALCVLLLGGCASSQVSNPNPAAGKAAPSQPTTLSLSPDTGKVITRGPYSFRLESVEVLSGGVSPFDGRGTISHRGGQRPAKPPLAAPGTRFVIVSLEIQGQGVDAALMRWYHGEPWIVIDAQRRLNVIGGDTREYDSKHPAGLMSRRSIFEVPVDAQSVTFAFSQTAGDGDVSIRLR